MRPTWGSSLLGSNSVPPPDPVLHEQVAALEEWFGPWRRVLVAYSGGVDSALVAMAARRTLGPGGVLAVLADSPSLPQRERQAALSLARREDITVRLVSTEEGKREGYTANEGFRCYYCKQELYTVLRQIMTHEAFEVVVNGTNADDLQDWRPGLKAAEEMAVRSPLLEVGISKQQVRNISRALGLQEWDKPAAPCLASRIPHGVRVTPERLYQIEQAEDVLAREGLHVFRVRYYGSEARLEIGADEHARLEEPGLKARLFEGVQAAGFTRVVIDPQPYRQGRLNEVQEGGPGGRTDRR